MNNFHHFFFVGSKFQWSFRSLKIIKIRFEQKLIASEKIFNSIKYLFYQKQINVNFSFECWIIAQDFLRVWKTFFRENFFIFSLTSNNNKQFSSRFFFSAGKVFPRFLTNPLKFSLEFSYFLSGAVILFQKYAMTLKNRRWTSLDTAAESNGPFSFFVWQLK